MNIKAVILDSSNSKDDALELLINKASIHTNKLSGTEIKHLVHEREKIATTLVSENIAFPHAVKQGMDESLIILGVGRKPILWTKPDQYVQVIVLFVGGNKQHLQSMSFTARILRNPVILKEILNAEDEKDVLDIIRRNSAATDNPADSESAQEHNIAMLKAAEMLQTELHNSALAVIDDVFSSSKPASSWYENFDGWVLTTRSCCLSDKDIAEDRQVSISNSDIIFTENELKHLTMEGYFKDIDSLIILYGKQASNSISSIRVVNLQHKEEISFIEGIPYDVSRRALQLAREIGMEGREGKPVGCLFVIGSEETLKDYTHQLIVNPFSGYPEEQRNIIDPSLEETVKEFSKIDGAFIIKPDGTIKSAGTYIAISPQTLEHHPGEGARHASARGITAVTDCLSIAVSESTGRVSVYARGQRIL
ncbi:MAG: diadenylate cyclase [Spirochaetales bacterium]|uniref:Diadenylate cyclase n=1 Tax=Candidatus Thalassospirochaeta sargassi TaxID=3119039 RepID=A0AAJ1ICV0_9SPIO|nr:diadenylate cyclase [Spirochaetales bacterium]